MNVLFINSARRGWGGNEQWMKLAAERLSLDHNVLLAYRDPDIGNRIEVTKQRLPLRHEFDLQTLVALVKLVKQHRIDVIIPTKRKDYALAGMASQICGCSNILRLGIVRNLENTLLNRLVYNRLNDGIIVNAESIKTALLESGFIDEKQIRVIYNGLDRQHLAIKARAYEPDLEGNFLITGMGELSERKGFDRLIEGFAQFLEIPGTSGAQLAIIGQGKMANSLRQLITRFGLQNKVILTGFLENPYPYLARSDVFVMTSNNEGISNALLEAAALGNALVSTPSGGGITHLLQHGKHCLFIDAGNPEDIAQSLYYLHNNPVERKQMNENARVMLDTTFSIEKMAADIIRFCSQASKKNAS